MASSTTPGRLTTPLTILLLLSCLTLSSSRTVEELRGSRPNVVVLLADDLGWGDVGCFGNSSLPTPNIDRICGEGARLSQHMAAASVCTPSRAALLTGRYPIRDGMVPTNIMRVFPFPSSSGGLPGNVSTFGTLASQAGYYTALVGKWHLGLHCGGTSDFCHHPRNHGFDYFFGHPVTNIKDNDGRSSVVDERMPSISPSLLTSAVVLAVTSLYLAMRGRPVIATSGVLLALSCVVVHVLLHSLTMLTSMLYRDLEVVEMPAQLQDMSRRLVFESEAVMDRAGGDTKPFLLFLSFIHVHTAIQLSKDFKGRSNFGKYGDAVMELDWSIGEVLNALENRGLMENTFVYLTSDNGGHTLEYGPDGEVEGGFNGIWRGGKTMGALEGGIRVPSAAMWRGVIPPATDVPHLTSQLDLVPTLAHLFGVDLPTRLPVDGRSMLPVLLGESGEGTTRFMAHYCGNMVHGARYVDGDHIWKIYYTTPEFQPGTLSCSSFVCDCWYGVVHHNPPLLFDLTSDPGEERPIPQEDPDYWPAVNTINMQVLRHRASVSDPEYQMTWQRLMFRPWLQPCCNFPYCRCSDPQHAHLMSSSP